MCRIRSGGCHSAHCMVGRRSAFGAEGDLLVEDAKSFGFFLNGDQFVDEFLFFLLQQDNVIGS